jgi:hypothetical protein
VKEALDQYWEQRPSYEEEAEFTLNYALHIRELDTAAGRKPFEPVHLNRHMREEQTHSFDRLLRADQEYRSIIATVASLGASVDTSKTGRRALLIAAAALLVAAVTVLAADFGNDSLLHKILQWF